MDIYNTIKNSKKYSNICDETINRIIADESKKYKSEKDVVKSVKTKLHQISGAFYETKKIDVNDDIMQIMRCHVSTLERIDFVFEMYEDIFKNVPKSDTVLDVACGFNPFILPFLKVKQYYAVDINVDNVNLLNEFFRLNNLNGFAYAGDVLYKIPEIESDVVFLFKILPLIEQQKKGYSKFLLDNLKSDWFVITFPTKSLSGKDYGMYNFYRNFMKENFPDYDYIFEREYKNELLLILKRR
ncbi:MAG: hypothetical protein FWF15_08655 [Oscillospiraceae bacterium]|nr:hypothetical protein [Oscillospiraceae bacterium]